MQRTLWVTCDYPTCERRVLQPTGFLDGEGNVIESQAKSPVDAIAEGRAAGWHIPQRTCDPHYCPKHARDVANAAEGRMKKKP